MNLSFPGFDHSSSSLSTACSVLTFSAAGQSASATIVSNNITLTFPTGADVSSVIYTFTISTGATASIGGISQVSGSSYKNNLGILGYLSIPQTFTVTAAAGNSTNYTITAICTLNNPVSYIGNTVNNSSGANPYWIEIIQPATISNVFAMYNNITSNTIGKFIEVGWEDPPGYGGGTNDLADGTNIIGNYVNYTGTIPYSGLENESLFVGHEINQLIKYNYSVNGQYSISNKASGYTNIIGATCYNVITGPTGYITGVGFKGVVNGNCFNNTFYNNYNGSVVIGSVYINSNDDDLDGNFASTGTTVKNNIFYSTYTTARFIYIDTASLTGFTCDYNIYYCPNGTPGTGGNNGSQMFRISGTTDCDFYTWVHTYGYDTHSVWINPNFVDFIYCVPSVPLNYALPIPAHSLGLAPGAVWTAGNAPATTYQSSTWQNGAWIVVTGLSLSINPTSLNFTSSSGTSSIAVTSNVSWTAVSNASWLTITSGSSGINNGVISLSYPANISSSFLSANITVTGIGTSQQICNVTQSTTSIYPVYTFDWNSIGIGMANPRYDQNNNQLSLYNPNGLVNTVGFNDSPVEVGTGGTNPSFPTDHRWGMNNNYSGNSYIDNTIQRYSGVQSMHLILNPFFPVVSSSNNGGQTCYTNYRSEIFWADVGGNWNLWNAIGTEVWMSWSVFYPLLSNILDQSAFAITNGSECVIRQWAPVNLVLFLNSQITNHGQYAANTVVFQNQASDGAYHYAGGVSSLTALASNIGHIVPGVWMDFVEHIIIDDGTLGNIGTYQLWVTIPPKNTLGYPTDHPYYPDCKYSNYSNATTPNTQLWHTMNGVRTAVSSGYEGVDKLGIYYGGPGWLNLNTASSPTLSQDVATASQTWMLLPSTSTYTYVNPNNSSDTYPVYGGGQNPSAIIPSGGSPGQMECYISRIKIEYNTGTIVTNGTIYNTLSGNTTGNYIDAYGQANVQP